MPVAMERQAMALRLDGANRMLAVEARGRAGSCSWRACNELLGGNVACRTVLGARMTVGARGRGRVERKGDGAGRRSLVVRANSSNVATGVVKKNMFKINLDEYMVTLEKPIGIRFAQTLSGKVYVEALAKKVNFDNFG